MKKAGKLYGDQKDVNKTIYQSKVAFEMFIDWPPCSGDNTSKVIINESFFSEFLQEMNEPSTAVTIMVVNASTGRRYLQGWLQTHAWYEDRI